MESKKSNNKDIVFLVSNNGCFDLQFRKDTRHKRVNSPTYYRWKIQFVVTVPREKSKLLGRLKKNIPCGKIHLIKNQARFSVQRIDDINDYVIPFFKKIRLAEKKKRDFDLWYKAADIISKNKGKYISKWKKNDLLSLMEIHKSSAKYKQNPKQPKWIDIAMSLVKSL